MDEGSVIIDTNLTVLLIVGSASRSLIATHRRLQDYDAFDFDLLGELVKAFDEILTVPHVLSETSNLVGHGVWRRYRAIDAQFRTFVEGVTELPVASLDGCRRAEFAAFGLTDAILLHVCSLSIAGTRPTLLTADSVLADTANSLGYSVLDYKRDTMSQ